MGPEWEKKNRVRSFLLIDVVNIQRHINDTVIHRKYHLLLKIAIAASPNPGGFAFWTRLM